MGKRFLIFSGHNDRAVVALCRFFAATDLPFSIIASGRQDAIHRTIWAAQVILNRLDAVVSLDWMCALGDQRSGPWIYCPTTEFINAFVLDNLEVLQGSGWEFSLPDKALYEGLTGKLSSQAMIGSMKSGLLMPALQSMAFAHAPCVLKPIANVSGGRVLYPLLCRTADELVQALAGLDPTDYFAQDFIEGQSHYLCAHLSRQGEVAHFWQTNLMQQAGGKSIVLARSGVNPGVDTTALLSRLVALGYHGPFMMEVIAAPDGVYYIEVNPRFWGPLQLALDVCPKILTLFAQDHGFEVSTPPSVAPQAGWYAWSYGAQQAGCLRLPAAQSLSASQLEQRLHTHDVYARADTAALHDCH